MATVVIKIEDIAGEEEGLFCFKATCDSDPPLPLLSNGDLDTSRATGAQAMGQVAMNAIRELMEESGQVVATTVARNPGSSLWRWLRNFLPLLLLVQGSCVHSVATDDHGSRESVPFSCSWTRKSCEGCLAVLRSNNRGVDLLVPVDRTACPSCNAEESACRAAPAGLKNWPDTRDEDTQSLLMLGVEE